MHTRITQHTRARTRTQVEEYLNDVITKMRNELRAVLKDSVAAYPTKPRDQWLFDWPSQVILVVNQIFWCQEVEQVRECVRVCSWLRARACGWLRAGTAALPPQGLPPLHSTSPRPPLRTHTHSHTRTPTRAHAQAFVSMGKGDKNAMTKYNEFQIKQLTKLIEVTRTDLKKTDRQKIMCVRAHAVCLTFCCLVAGLAPSSLTHTYPVRAHTLPPSPPAPPSQEHDHHRRAQPRHGAGRGRVQG